MPFRVSRAAMATAVIAELFCGAGKALAQEGSMNSVQVRGQLVAQRAATLSMGIAGIIEAFPPALGEYVERGATLIALDCAAERAQRNSAAARLEAAESRLKVNERLGELNAVSGLELDLTRSERRVARAELVSIDAQLEKCGLTAPFAGRIVDREVRVHEFVKAGQPALRLVDQTALWIDFVAPSRWLRWLEEGASFEVVIDETGSRHSARVEAVVDEVDPVSQSVQVRGRFAEGAKTDQLLPGMSGDVVFSRPRP